MNQAAADPKTIASHKRTPELALLLVPIFLASAWAIGVGLVDDAYIFLRYASNAYHGLGLVFNTGERVEGYTSPLWLALIVPLFAVADDPSAQLMVLGGVCGLATILLIAWRRSMLGGAFLATHPAFVFWSFSGLETPLASLCLVGTFLLLMDGTPSRRRYLWAGVVFALAFLARPDCVWVLPFVVLRIVGASGFDPRRIVSNAALFALPSAMVAVHLVWRVFYYGDWLPNTYYAKAGMPRTMLFENGLQYVFKGWGFLVPLGLAIPLMPREYRWVLIPLVIGWLWMVLTLGGDFFAFFRFGVPLLALVACGIGAVSEGPRAVARRWMPIGALGGVILASNVLLATGSNRDLAREEVAMARAWSRTGKALAAVVQADASIATLVAGAIPYYSNHRAIDLLGLTDRQIARHGRIDQAAVPGHQRYDSDYVLEQRPLVIVLPDSGRYKSPRHAAAKWPQYTEAERRYFHALADLVERAITRELYEYRTTPLSDGTWLEALWLRDR